MSDPDRPNIVFILTDDHAAHAISAYGSRVNSTPNMDRIAADGARLDACYCTNSICSPSRATILSGTYSHVNGVKSIFDEIEYRVPNFTGCLRQAGYRTALFGKWHLGHRPENLPRAEDFDAWQVFPGQGDYNDPVMITAEGERQVSGYATDIVTDLSLDWLDQQPDGQPFCLMVHHKAPHRPWVPDPKHADLYPVGSIPEPDTLFDDYATRGRAAHEATMRIADHLPPSDIKEQQIPAELIGEEHRTERTRWFYQRYMRDYLQTVQSVDDNVGRVLDYLNDHDLGRNTIVVYTSDQGFFLGDHGWYDKRFIYDESLQMPFLIKWPERIVAGSRIDEIITNADFAATFLQACGLDPAEVLPTSQGRSALPVLLGDTPDDWPTSMYYRYWEHDDPNHHAWSHYGVRTATHKLVYFYAAGLGTTGASDKIYPPEWELYDLVADPQELNNVADDPSYAGIRAELETELARLQQHYQDEPYLPV
ncbi:sulfatase family protein [Microlunatus soli]|uniref:Arylsulfatase A n=1 Tax=Microlunatus soli TaxID=630515 RepID=A0A1H1UJW6_9ACTN|nr:sulfatase [Microlunatus soli]SDS72139.1 Arylsulfatase A [Microlunatus soli]